MTALLRVVSLARQVQRNPSPLRCRPIAQGTPSWSVPPRVSKGQSQPIRGQGPARRTSRRVLRGRPHLFARFSPLIHHPQARLLAELTREYLLSLQGARVEFGTALCANAPGGVRHPLPPIS